MNGNMVRCIALFALSLALAPVAGAAAPATGRPAIGQVVRFEKATLYLPPAAAHRKVALLLIFPGTGGNADPMVRVLRPAADAAGFALLGFSPTGENFDTIDRFFDAREARLASAMVNWPEPEFGKDAAQIFRTIDDLATVAPIDTAKVGLIGFSHGASFALSLGLRSPDRFRSIVALSPGLLLLPPGVRGGQSVFLAHGRHDTVQPYRRTACSMVPKLASLGYRIRFAGFDGGHEVPDAVLRDGLIDFLEVVDGTGIDQSDPGRSTADCAKAAR